MDPEDALSLVLGWIEAEAERSGNTNELQRVREKVVDLLMELERG